MTAAHAEALLPRPPPAQDYGTLQRPTPLASAAPLAPAPLPDSSGVGDKDMKVSWWDWSDPWWLLAYTASEVGGITFALLCMVSMVLLKKEFCMDCEIPGLRPWEVGLCEYTKSYVRLFPLLGLVVALAVASRTLLRRHFFYQMLKHRVVVRLQSKKPLQDWLFLALIVGLLHVLCHFFLYLRTTKKTAAATMGQELKGVDQQITNMHNYLSALVKDNLKDVQLLNLYYCAPAICFMIFLWTSYDVEQTLLPLSKFMEGDAEQARERLASTVVIDEVDAHRAVMLGLDSVKDDEDGYQLEDLCRRMTEHAERLEQLGRERKALGCPTCGAIMLAGSSECANCATSEEETTATAVRKLFSERIPVIDFTKSYWIADLMIDRQLDDEESRKFRRVWYVYSVFSLLVTAVVAGCFMFSMYKHVYTAAKTWENGTFSLVRVCCSCFAELLHLCVTVHVGVDFVRQEWRSLREEAKHQAAKNAGLKKAKAVAAFSLRRDAAASSSA